MISRIARSPVKRFVHATCLVCSLYSVNIYALNTQNSDDEWDMVEWEDEQEQPHAIAGFFEAAVGGRVSNDSVISTDKTLADVRFQLQYDYTFENAALSINADAFYDGVLEKTQLQLREAAWQGNLSFLGEWGRRFDAKVGQQVLTWGTGDYVFLNDLFPKDYQSFFSGRDDEYLKAPSLSLKLSGYFDIVNIDVVVTPEFTPDVYINGDYFSFFSPLAGAQVAPGFDVLPPLRPESPEYALRLYKTADSTEYALYAYDGFYKNPSSYTDAFEPTFSALRVYGASLITPVGQGLINAEFAYYDSTDDKQGNEANIPNSQTRWLLGYQQEIVKNLSGGVQFYVERIRNHDALLKNSLAPQFEVEKNRVWLTQRLTYQAMQQTLTLSVFNFFSTTENDGYSKININYSPADTWRLSFGLHVFYGEQPHTFFGQFEDASNVFVRYRWFY